MRFSNGLRLGLLWVGLLFLAACHSDKDDRPAPTFSVGGTVSGLTGSVGLANNGGDTHTVSASGAFTFATGLAAGTNYNVTVTSQPANQTCSVTSASGTISAANVTSVSVSCTTNTFSVGGSVTGLVGSVRLTNNGSDARTVNADGAFTFAIGLTNGAGYSVAVESQPENQHCTLASATGTIATANVSNVVVGCETIRVVASVGPAGGTVIGPGGARVIIPAGALTQATDIGVARPLSGWPLPLPEGATLVGRVYELTPHDLIFGKPVVIRLPVPAGAGNFGAFVATFGEDWHQQDVLQTDDYIELERNTFSWYSGYNLNDCAYSGPPRVGICSSGPHISGRSWATATPASAIMMTSGGSLGSVPNNTYSAAGSAGTWAVDLDTVQTVQLSMEYTAAADCGNGHVQLRRIRTGAAPQIFFDTPTVITNGRGITTIDIPRTFFDEGLAAYFFRYTCTRAAGGERGGGDWITFNGRHAPNSGYIVGGTVAGLSVPGLKLQIGLREILNVPSGAGAFAFGTPLKDGSSFEVRVHTQPQGALCTLANHKGIISSANVSNVAVICTPTGVAPRVYTVVANGTQRTATLFGRQAGSGSLTSLDSRSTGNTPRSVAITPFGPFIYIANMGDGSITPFSIDNATNTLVTIPLSSLATPNPSAMTIDPLEGRFLWVTNNNFNTVSSFSINTSTGQLTAQGTIPTGRLSSAIAAHPNGNFVFAASEGDSGIYRYQVNRASGQLTALGSLTNAVLIATDLAIVPSGNFGYALSGTGNITRLSVNGANGQLGILGFTAVNGSSSCEALTIHPNGSFLFTTCSNALGAFVAAFSMDPATGALTAGANTAIGVSGPATLALERGGLVMHVAHQLSNTVYTFGVNPSTGGLTSTGSAATGNGPMAIASVP